MIGGPYFVRKGDKISLNAWASEAVTLNALVTILRAGSKTDFSQLDGAFGFTTAADRTISTLESPKIPWDGYVVHAVVNAPGAANLKRGACAAKLVRATDLGQLALGYVYAHHDVVLGMDEELGPGGGEGALSWVSLAADIAPVDVTRVLAATNAFRRIHGFVWDYKASADAATRTIVVTLRQPGLALPTGMSARAIWTSATVTMTLNEDGTIFVRGVKGGAYGSSQDTGSLSIDNTGTNPLPFPYDATEDDLADLFFDVGSAHANDLHSIYLLQEEWLPR